MEDLGSEAVVVKRYEQTDSAMRDMNIRSTSHDENINVNSWKMPSLRLMQVISE